MGPILARGAAALLTAAAGVMAAGLALAQPAGPSPALWRSSGEAIWIRTPEGRMKTRAYRSARTIGHPVLMVYVPGDLGPGDGHFQLAAAIAGATQNLVAVAVTRPGYTDAEGDRSDGRKGYAIGDNYTAAVVDDIDAAVRQLRARFKARAVVLIGHSGGAGITANLMGRHPGDAEGAVLIACSCDPAEFMTRWTAEHAGYAKDLPNPSLLPLQLAARVSPRAHVRLVIGSQDKVVRLAPSQAYAAALKARGIDVRLVVVPEAGHVDVLSSPPSRQAVAELLTLEGATVVPPQPGR